MAIDEKRLARLVAKDEITEVIHRVARGTDRLDHALMVSGYWPDGYDDHNAFRGGPVEFADWVLQALGGFAITQHVLGQVRIELDGDVARVETYCNAHHVAHPDERGVVVDMRMGLRYCDRFECRQGEWRIAKRVCAFDWAYYVSSDRPWPFPDDYTVGARRGHDLTDSWF
jgi:SnoaL-like domain